MENNVIRLSKEDRGVLEKFVNTGVHSAKLIKRATVLLALDRSDKKDHLRITRIGEEKNISRRAIYDIRNAYLAAPDIETFLTRKKRETPPVPAKITGDAEAHIIALACSKPPEGYARWTLRLLAEKAVELNYIESIGRMSVDRLLKKHRLSLN